MYIMYMVQQDGRMYPTYGYILDLISKCAYSICFISCEINVAVLNKRLRFVLFGYFGAFIIVTAEDKQEMGERWDDMQQRVRGWNRTPDHCSKDLGELYQCTCVLFFTTSVASCTGQAETKACPK